MDKVVVFDFGSQYTQLIARRVRELNVYCEIIPYKDIDKIDTDTKAIILSGSPCSVKGETALSFDLDRVLGRYPILGICYGAQYMAHALGGDVQAANKREYGRAEIELKGNQSTLFKDVVERQVWMSHADSILTVPDDFELIAHTASIPIAGFQGRPGRFEHPVFGIQFHPEVTHSTDGRQILRNFVIDIAGCDPSWTPKSYVESSVESIRDQVEIFEDHAQREGDIKWLAQGTIYPDVIESVSVHGPSVTIKSHHNVGGLPEKLNLKIIEPLRSCFKDEVRLVGAEIQVPQAILDRHPFPGPGLAIRIIGDITPEKVHMLQEVDDIFIKGLKKSGYMNQNLASWGNYCLRVRPLGVIGDERTYEKPCFGEHVQSDRWYDGRLGKITLDEFLGKRCPIEYILIK
ncbi:UNVERIFIED_CONTAM: hypothetical protein GTU68_032511 [Idotea baltica]|nr:hypothetical protein [Idotea baltica]